MAAPVGTTTVIQLHTTRLRAAVTVCRRTVDQTAMMVGVGRRVFTVGAMSSP